MCPCAHASTYVLPTRCLGEEEAWNPRTFLNIGIPSLDEVCTLADGARGKPLRYDCMAPEGEKSC